MTISVIIPTHNRLNNLKESIVSVFNQRTLPIEVIVVDDGSVPAVSDDVFAFAPESVNCILIRNITPQGGNFARNKGASLARGEYIAFLDDDDTWDCKKLELQSNLMRSKALDLSYTGKNIITVDENSFELSRRFSFAKPMFSNLSKSIMRRNFIGTTSSIMVRKSSFNTVGGFNVEMPALQDYEFYIRFIFHGFSVGGIENPLVNYYVRKNKSAISRDLKKNIGAVVILLKIHGLRPYMINLWLGCARLLSLKILRVN